MARLPVFNPFNLLPNLLDEDFSTLTLNPSVVFPPIDMYDEGDKIVIKAELPGFEPEDIQVRIDESGVLHLSGRKKVKEEKKGKKYYIREISERSFTRSVALPVEVEADKASAEFKDGVLTLSIPKVKQEKSKSISIKVIKK